MTCLLYAASVHRLFFWSQRQTAFTLGRGFPPSTSLRHQSIPRSLPVSSLQVCQWCSMTRPAGFQLVPAHQGCIVPRRRSWKAPTRSSLDPWTIPTTVAFARYQPLAGSLELPEADQKGGSNAVSVRPVRPVHGNSDIEGGPRESCRLLDHAPRPRPPMNLSSSGWAFATQ